MKPSFPTRQPYANAPSPEQIHSGVASNRAGWVSTGEFAVAALLLVTGMFIFPEYPNVDLDPTWRIVLAQAFFRHFQFGHQLVFTHGPLGFLIGNTYDGEHFWPLIGWQVARSCIFSYILLSTARNLPVIARWIFFTGFLLFGFFFEHTLHLVVVLFAALREMRRTTQPTVLHCVAFGSGLAFLSTMKFLTLLLAAPAVAIVGIFFWSKSWRHAAGWTLGGYAVGLVLIWIGCRQDLSHLPDYFLNSWRMSQGYGAAMALAPPDGVMEKGLGALALCGLFLVVHLATGKMQLRSWLEAGLIGAYAFLTWKHGFVRADGHIGGFFIGMLLPATCLTALLDNSERLRAWKWGLACLWGVLSLWGLHQSKTVATTQAWAVYYDKMAGDLDHVRHWKAFRESYETQIRQILARYPLNKTREIVGDASIDMLGHEAGLICLHRLNYRPRPVFQSYAVYSRELDLLNLHYLQSDEAPRFLLQKIQSIDGRLMTLDEASVLRTLPGLYEFILIEDGYILWHRRLNPSAPDAAPMPTLLSGAHKLNTVLSLAGISQGPLWMEIDLPLTTAGVLRSFLYQAPIIELLVRDSTGTTSRYRLPLSQGKNGFLMNPIIDDTTSYLRFAAREDSKPIESVTVSTNSDQLKLVADEFKFSVKKITQPYPVQSLAELQPTVYRRFKPKPDAEVSHVPPLEGHIGEYSVTMMHAPSEMQFSLRADPGRISGKFGFLERAYTEGGQTDGALFEIVWTDNIRREVLFSRFLDPLHVATDRGIQSFSLDLKKLYGGRLVLKTDPGPTGNNGWDWTAWADIEIQQSN